MPNSLENIKTKILHPNVGMEISGIDLKEAIPDSVFKYIIEKFNQHYVILFRNQVLNDQQQIDFSRQFGQLEPISIFKAATNRYIYQISNIDNRGNIVSSDSQKHALLEINQRWHMDSSFKSPPAMASILSCRQTPKKEKAFTEFASLRVAYNKLTQKKRQNLLGRVGIHNYNYSLSRVGKTGVSQKELDALPPVEHPLLHLHLASNKPSLFLSSHISSIKGMSYEASHQLIEDLINECTSSDDVYTHEWLQNDVLMWDNQCVMHRVTNIPKNEVRRAHRTTIAGHNKLKELKYSV